jgi:G6PDH family F420-dependent oxidoreductase
VTSRVTASFHYPAATRETWRGMVSAAPRAVGHSPNAWGVLGAAAQATQALPLMTFVTCPTFRYHPAVAAQQAATLGVLSGGRFTLGLGAGENLNEHVIGAGWPMARVRQERLAEAAEIIRSLFIGDYVNF